MKKLGLLKIFVLMFFFLSFFSFFVFSEDTPFITYVSKPKISLEFSEPVNILDVDMFNLDYPDVEYDTDFFEIVYSVDRLNVTLTPNLPLENGLYELVLLVEDLVGNKITYKRKIFVDVPITDIVMMQPRLLRMNSTIGDIIIHTKEPQTGYYKNAECRYAHLLGYSLLKKFETANHFDQTNSSEHIIYDYDFTQSFNKNFYAICIDDDGRTNYKFFKLDYDLEPPIIQDVEFNPPVLITMENNFSFEIETNEDSFCFFDLLGEKYYFNNLTKDDEFLVSSYTKNHKIILKDVLPQENGFYGFNVVCQDRALWKTNEFYEYEVDLSAALRIFVETPKEFSSDYEFVLDFFTNKPSYCLYDYNGSGMVATTSTTDNPLENHRSLNTLFAQPGINIINFECISDSGSSIQRANTQYEFIVDDTPPTKPILGGSNFSCVANTLELSAYSEDNESGIDYFMYLVEESATKKLIDWTKSENSEIVISDSNLNTTDGKIYYVSVEAYNKAGLKSPISTKQITYDESGNSCDDVAPVVTINTSLKSGLTYVNMDCFDNNGMCIDFIYNLVDYGNCVPQMPYYGEFILDDNYILCYSAMDRAGNKVNGSRNVSVFESPDDSGHCFNEIFEPHLNETDLDCGGDCFGCKVGARCDSNSDCITGFCDAGFCANPSCDDGAKNGRETDVDCGGPCVLEGFLCLLGQKCLSHKDCTTGFCSSNYTCSDSGCSDGIKNGNETDLDCGGLSCSGCSVGLSCRIDEDCESNYCLNGKCEDYKKKDSDGDGLPDWWEEKYFGCPTCADPNGDPDNDNLKNIDEYKYGTHPLKKDTDGDRYSDYIEILAGTDPLDPNDHPTNWLFLILVFVVMVVIAYLVSSYTFDYFKPLRDQKLKAYLDKRKAEEKKKKEAQKSQIKIQPKKEEIIIPAKKIVKKKPKKKKIKINLEKEKERGKIFDAFEGKTDLKSEEFKKRLAERLKNKKKGKKKSIKKKIVKQNLSELEKFEEQSKVDDPLEKIINSQNSIDRIINKTNDSFDKLSNVGKKNYSDKLENIGKNNKSIDRLNELLEKKKNSVDKLSQIGNNSKKSELMNKFAQTLESGQGIELFETLIKELINEGKIDKDDIKHLLMEIYLSGKISNDFYNKLKQNLSL